MKTAGTANNGELDRKEWDFEKVPKTELGACYLYEYSRELLNRPREVSESHRSKQFEKKFLTKFATAMFIWGFGDLLKDYSSSVSWQELNQEVRSKIATRSTNKFDSGGLDIKTLGQLEDDDIKDMDQFARLHRLALVYQDDLERTELGLFAINWNHDDRHIKQAFAEFLLEGRKECKARGWTKIRYKLKGRGGFRDRLNWLGALRVLNHYPNSQLVESGLQRIKIHSICSHLHSHLSDLYESAKRASTLLQVMAAIMIQ